MAKSKSTAMKLSSHVPTSSSSAKNLITSSDPVKRIATVKLESRIKRNSRPHAASSSQARLQDAYLGGLMATATGKPVVKKDPSETETGRRRCDTETGC